MGEDLTVNIIWKSQQSRALLSFPVESHGHGGERLKRQGAEEVLTKSVGSTFPVGSGRNVVNRNTALSCAVTCKMVVWRIQNFLLSKRILQYVIALHIAARRRPNLQITDLQ